MSLVIKLKFYESWFFLKESTGEHIEYDENQTENHEFFRMMFMMSPGIVLFCALFHLAFDWVGFIRVMVRKCFQFMSDKYQSF